MPPGSCGFATFAATLGLEGALPLGHRDMRTVPALQTRSDTAERDSLEPSMAGVLSSEVLPLAWQLCLIAASWSHLVPQDWYRRRTVGAGEA